MPSAAFLAHGTLIAIETTPSVFATVAELTDIQVTMQGEEIRTSIHNEPNAWDNYLLGPKSAEVALTMNYLPSHDTHDYISTSGLLYHFNSGTKKNWRLTFINGNIWTFVAFIRTYNVSAPTDGVLGLNCVLRIDGQPALN